MKTKIYCDTCYMLDLGIIDGGVGDIISVKNFPTLKGHEHHQIRHQKVD